MARSISEIYDEIITEKETMASLSGLLPAPDDSQTFLQDLSSTSKVAIWRLWAWVTAVAINIHEKIFDLHKAEIEARALEIPTGTAIWYHEQALKFQFGDSLTWNGVAYVYPTITPANQIVKLVAVVDLSFLVRIKAAKLDGGGNPIPLTAPELSAFEGYIIQIKFAGTSTIVTSSVADDLQVDYFIKYDPLVMAPDGSLLDDPATFPVKDAINAYASSLPFNGKLTLMELTDAVQLAEGVVDVTLNTASAKFGALPYVAINKEYTPDAGYLVLDEGTSVFTYNTINV